MPADATATILENVGAALAALSALSTAAFGLLDTSKAFWGGTSNFGLGHLKTALLPFRAALDEAVGEDWFDIVRANWINGLPKADQKSVLGSLLKLGLTQSTATDIAKAAHVEPDMLGAAAAAMAAGTPLTDPQMNVLGRMAASMEAKLDAAFERAEQQYRNVSRLLAGVVAMVLALVAEFIWSQATHDVSPTGYWTALGVGILAVPVAPVAKDLTSALSNAMRAIKAAKAL